MAEQGPVPPDDDPPPADPEQPSLAATSPSVGCERQQRDAGWEQAHGADQCASCDQLRAAVELAEKWQANYKLALEREREANEQLRRDLEMSKPAVDRLLVANESLLRERDAARRLVHMLLEYSTEGLDYDALPEWARRER